MISRFDVSVAPCGVETEKALQEMANSLGFLVLSSFSLILSFFLQFKLIFKINEELLSFPMAFSLRYVTTPGTSRVRNNLAGNNSYQ